MFLMVFRLRFETGALISTPMNSILPVVSGSRPMIVLTRVLLPQPDSPTMPSVRPRLTSRSTSSTALTSCLWRLNIFFAGAA